MSEAIKVVIRIRPMNQKESDRGCSSITKVDEENNQVTIVKPHENDNAKVFAYDSVFDANSEQSKVYAKTAYNLVENVLTGYNGTIFAYGQTGCGKTHSMVGKIENEELQGIIPRSFGHILNTISETAHKEFLLRCSFIEIYNEEVRDLLGKDVKKALQIKQSPDKGVFIKDLTANTAKTHEELMEFMNIGNRVRSVGETAMNKDSSRSHLLFMLYLESADICENANGDQKKYVASKLNLVDLAGSERINKTGAQGDRLQEAKSINLSLSALGNVISALVDGKSHHIPYRDSKLTRLLQDSLGGNTKTVMIANCSPADYNFDETLSTLRYASRAKFIKNKPIINEDPKDALLKQYGEEIKKLKSMLQNGGTSLQQNEPGHSEQFHEQLALKESELKNEKQEKEKLLERIKMLEQQHFCSEDIQVDAKIKEKVQRARMSVEMQEWESMKKNKDCTLEEEDIKNADTKQQSEYFKKVYRKLKEKVKNLETELRDINQENYTDKEGLLDDIRDLSKENKLLEGIIDILLSPPELATIRELASSSYNEDKQEYKIPPFYFKNKDLVFPKLAENQALEMIRENQKDRQIVWEKRTGNGIAQAVAKRQNKFAGASRRQSHKSSSQNIAKIQMPSHLAALEGTHHINESEESKLSCNYSQNMKKELTPIAGKENGKKKTMVLNDLIKDAKQGHIYSRETGYESAKSSQHRIEYVPKCNPRKQLEPIKKVLGSRNQ